MDAGWLFQGFQPPAAITRVDECTVPKPQPVPLPTQLLTGSLKGLRSDEELAAFVAGSKGGNTAVVEFGTTWCVKCHEMFPQFYQLTKKYPQHKYAMAQVETMHQTVNTIKYTPTFGIYRNGKKVDEVIGKEPQRLEDHLWLHSD